MTTALTMVGLQSALFWIFARVVAIQKKLLFPNALFKKIRPLFTLERCLPLGGTLIAIGVGTSIYALLYWYNLSFGKVEGETLIKLVCAASFLFGTGFQLVFASFFIYLLDQQTDNSGFASSAHQLDDRHC
jgi:hypothetical protein